MKKKFCICIVLCVLSNLLICEETNTPQFTDSSTSIPTTVLEVTSENKNIIPENKAKDSVPSEEDKTHEEVNKRNFNEKWKKFRTFVAEDFFANFLALIGGLFGFISFLIGLPKKIKPISFVSDKIEINTEIQNFKDPRSNKETISKRIKDIKAPISFVNRSKKGFLITDIFIKIYENNSYTPESDIYHVTQISMEESIIPFTTILMNPDEVFTSILYFSENQVGQSKGFIEKDFQYTIEIYIVINDKKVKLINRINTLHFDKNDTEPTITLNSISGSINRRKFEDKIKSKPKFTSLIKGIYGRVGDNIFHFFKYKLFIHPLYSIFNIFPFCLSKIKTFIYFISHKILVTTIFKYYAKKAIKYSSSCNIGSPDSNAINEFSKLIALLKKDLLKLDSTGKIITSEYQENHSFNLIKNDYNLHIYLPGGDSIIVQELSSTSEIHLHFIYKKIYWFHCWTYNGKFISTSKMASIILNYFIERSLH